MEQEVMLQKHPVLQLSTECYYKKKTKKHNKQTSPPPAKGKKKPKQTKATFLFILLINQDGVLPPWNGSCDLLLNDFRSLLTLTQWATGTANSKHVPLKETAPL